MKESAALRSTTIGSAIAIIPGFFWAFSWGLDWKIAMVVAILSAVVAWVACWLILFRWLRGGR